MYEESKAKEQDIKNSQTWRNPLSISVEDVPNCNHNLLNSFSKKIPNQFQQLN
jgi:hypothetical protein